MTAIELSQQKIEIIDMLMDVTDEKILSKVVLLIGKKKPVSTAPLERISPFTCTVEELRSAARASVEDHRKGRCITNVGMGKMIATWGSR